MQRSGEREVDSRGPVRVVTEGREKILLRGECAPKNQGSGVGSEGQFATRLLGGGENRLWGVANCPAALFGGTRGGASPKCGPKGWSK